MKHKIENMSPVKADGKLEMGLYPFRCESVSIPIGKKPYFCPWCGEALNDDNCEGYDG